jgi:hypothetical protein
MHLPKNEYYNVNYVNYNKKNKNNKNYKYEYNSDDYGDNDIIIGSLAG